MCRKLWRCALVLLCVGLLSSMMVVSAAEETSFSYTYDAEGNSQSVPAPYTTERTLYGAEAFGGTALKNPADFFATETGNIYILDSGNDRIVVLNASYGFTKAVTLTMNGEMLSLEKATGIFADDHYLYIADRDYPAVFIADHDGNVLRYLEAPPEDKVEADFIYAPTRVVAGTDGVVYVISANTYAGALQYDEKGTFLGFFGSDSIVPTMKVRLNRIWKKILSDEAASGLQRNVPISFAQFDIDSKNFLYTIRSGTGTESGQVRRVNPNGVNVLLDGSGSVAMYGDLETWFNTKTNQTVSTVFTDVTVDEEGFFTLLDATRKRLFQYDGNTNLLYAFGGEGTQQGTFLSPVAVENHNGAVLVLDSGLGGIHVLTPTVFGRGVRTAISLYNEGLYEEAALYWEDILRQDAYYELANTGMGKVYERMGDYDAAMEYYRNGSDRDGYSSAFSAKWAKFVRENFLLILIGVVLLLSLIVGYTIYCERHPVNDYELRVPKNKMPMRCLKHPFKGFFEMRQKNLHSIPAAAIILALWFLVAVVSTQLTAYHFNPTADEELNIFVIFAKTIGIYLLFVICNWAVSTLADGRGKLSEIACYTAYAIMPYIITQVLLIIVSNLFSLDEAAFYHIIQAVGIFCTAVYLLVALKEVHEYSVVTTLATIAGTILGMYFVLLIITIVYSMFAQLIGFVVMLYSELRLR